MSVFPTLTQYNSAGQIVAPMFGNVTAFAGAPPYSMEAAAPGDGTDPASLRGQPSRLLHARHRFIAFTGRDADMQRLRRWRDAVAPTKVMLLHAPGGHGKTRLALELMEDSANAGWLTWHAKSAQESLASGSVLRSVGAEGGRHLVVADYADRWDHPSLSALCTSVANDPGEAARILLLSRTLRGWWALRGELDELGLSHAAFKLEPVAPEGGRRALFESAKAQFASLFAQPLERTAPAPRSLDAEQYSSVLSIHMAALAAVPIEGDAGRPPEGVDEVAAFLLAREIRNWERLRSADRDFHSGYRALAQTVFTAVLTGPHHDYRDAQQALRRAGVHDDLDQILDDHRALYPPADDRDSLEPLYPDRLAEDFLGLLTPGHRVSFYTNPWAVTAPMELLRRTPGEEAPVHTGQTLIFLAAAAARWPHLHQTLTKVLEADPALAVLGGGAALHAVATATGLSVDVLEGVAGQLPSELELDLMPGAEAVITAVVDRRLAEPDQSPVARGYMLAEVAQLRALIGDYRGAAEQGSAAVEVLRGLADDAPDDHGPMFGQTLSTHAQTLATLLRFDEAFEAIEEAEVHVRRHASPSRGLLSVDIGSVLSVKSAILQAAGRLIEAQRTAEEGESLLPAPSEGHPARIPALINLTMTRALAMRRQGRLEEAFAIAGDLCRQVELELGEDDEGGFAALTYALYNFGSIAGEAGHYEEAHEALARVVEQCDILEPLNPGKFTSLRRNAEWNLKAAAEVLSQPHIGPRKRPMNLRLHSELLQRSSFSDVNTGTDASIDPGEALELMDRGKAAMAEGQHKEGLAALRSSLDIMERLHKREPTVDVESALAMVLLQWALARCQTGDWRGSLEPVTRAATLLRKLQRLDPEFLDEFGVALALQAEALDRSGRSAEARTVRGELNSIRPHDRDWPV